MDGWSTVCVNKGGLGALEKENAMNVPTDNIKDHMDRIAELVSGDILSVLEIGTEYGTGSTQAIRTGLERHIGKYIVEAGQEDGPDHYLWVSVDIRDQITKWLRPGWPWWHMVTGDSSDVATLDKVKALLMWQPETWGDRPYPERYPRNGFELIFIDTIHTYEYMTKELRRWSLLANASRCVWLFHDTWMNGTRNPMCDAIEEFAADTGMRFEHLSKACHGLGALFPVKQP